ncbi:MAG: hypothetical protein ACRC8S_13390 [Fimbriiglobus sp.]
MIAMKMTTVSMPTGDIPVCSTEPPYDLVGNFFTHGANSTRADGFTEGFWACNKVASGALSEASVGGSEAHDVRIMKPDVVIEQYFISESSNDNIIQTIPFDLFREALNRWRQFVRKFEKDARRQNGTL